MIKSFIKRSIKNNIKNNTNRCKIVDFESINRIIILYEVENIEKILDVKSLLEKEGKELFLFGYSSNKSDQSPIKDGLFLNQRQINLFYYPKKDIEIYFEDLSKKCDALIDLTNSNHLSLCYLISKSKGLLKLGLNTDRINLFDIIFEIEKNVDAKFLSQHLLFYLRKLKVKS